ncbi:uncharacterized protein LOC133745727 [Rosa rugosa]|uniref:uncharacterized protein LOC133745727 n=1 Tax=Rosa rugosa TaxID=74645 RepID=UPI002B4039E8|nr:uncharacterized protein LOC133745727 [Rosa rugosa]
MGNCMETCAQKQQEEDQMQQMQKQKGDEIRFGKEGINSGEDGKLRVKIVLTKEELQMLMLQLQDKGGKKSLEEVLEEIQKGRGKLVLVEEAWKPSLDSIMECPELFEDMDR